MSSTKIKCNCKNTYQDQIYGAGVRIANECMVKEKLTGYRCTVCGVKYTPDVVKKT